MLAQSDRVQVTVRVTERRTHMKAKHDEMPLSQNQASAILHGWVGAKTPCIGIEALVGGYCSAVYRLTFDRPPYVAVAKLHGSSQDCPLSRESDRLEFLREHTNVPCPRVYSLDTSRSLVPYSFLLLECLPGVSLESVRLTKQQRAPVERELADVVLELHSFTAETFRGIDEPRGPRSWLDVFLPCLEENRRDMQAILPDDLLELLDRVLPLASDALGKHGEPTLIHGDLWAGNIMVHEREDGWHLSGLLDPVGLRYAEVEMELSYLEVFDTVGQEFFDIYGRQRPLRPGYSYRRLFYWLDTFMTHIWLGFGPKYQMRLAAACRELIRLSGSA